MALLWVDKHRPKTLDDVDYHGELSERLKRLASSKNQPNMLFVGPSGAGKSTRIHALLREVYGPGVDSIKVETRSVAPNPNTPSNTVDIQVVVSNYHLQLSPSDVGSKDRAVVMQLIKETAQHPPLGGVPFKVVVIEEAGSLSSQAQAALRRTMERYMRTCRLILTCESASQLIAPLRSRCLAVRVSAPSNEQIQAVLQKVAKIENIKLPSELAARIAEKSNRDMRRAVLMLECAHSQSYPFSKDQKVPPEAWEVAIEKVTKKMVQEQTPKMVMEVRGMLYELMAACLPADFILKEMCRRLAAEMNDEEVKQKTINAAAHFESTMRQGSKDIFHLEAFVLRFMADYKASKERRGGR
eukprot:gnl/TRDRNA2_/TRDRNA2_178842_c0_seq1.p1 gnl/TRDRNA2_/TRDRNA2_178842_c0~~gnl/TRDRNA2_/TRDRNA2_178842_c0_seq1.p1  ORF type:complete len:356 (-),score=93.12 gnl/TRDRNA2_/TRDRNA2_178842_c0_seq1:131-1198(-)